jgi:dephospho-CoA kinase
VESVLIVGLTGGIASGKSTVGERFAELGAYRIDTDVLARRAVEPGEAALTELIRFFGEGITDSEGRLDRQKLAAVVFADLEKRQMLNKITHPAVRSLLHAELAHARKIGACIALVEVPLLYEAGFESEVDCVIVVTADEKVQLARLMARNNYTEAEAWQRIHAQMPLAEKAARADYVIDNNGGSDATLAQVKKLWEALRRECTND